ncbi:glycosyltransferase family 2 protein, partial [bacterium]|nr:glycosyltransferase family 2 protein [bacterium]
MIKVSIIIPVYNMAHYLKQSLDSVRNQTLKDIEIICINDCSEDNSLDILMDYASKDKRFVILNLNENRDQGYARNLGIMRANGEYIMFLDPDDWYEVTACEDAYNEIIKNNDDMVFFGMTLYDAEKKKYSVGYKHYHSSLQALKKSTNVKESFIPYCGFSVVKIYKRDFLLTNDCKFTETRCGEDRPFAVKTTLKAKKISFLDKKLYYYRINQNDNKRKRILNERTWQEARSNVESMLSLIVDNDKDCEFSIRCINLMIKFYLGHLKEFLLLYKNDKNKIYKQIHDFLINVNKIYNVKDIYDSEQ